MRAGRINDLEGAYGDLPDEPWFDFTVLGTLSDGGTYTLPLPTGTHEIVCFQYGYLPGLEEPTILDGLDATAGFTLDRQ
ncbi:MAG: hypothetical protein R6U37_07905 [Dehalococcoidia bacterium]